MRTCGIKKIMTGENVMMGRFNGDYRNRNNNEEDEYRSREGGDIDNFLNDERKECTYVVMTNRIKRRTRV